MAIDIDKLKTGVLGTLEEHFGVDREELNPNVDSLQLAKAQAQITELSVGEAFDAWCKYEGYLGSTGRSVISAFINICEAAGQDPLEVAKAL